jgi:hypothetical protein
MLHGTTSFLIFTTFVSEGLGFCCHVLRSSNYSALCSNLEILIEQVIVTHLQDHQVSLPEVFGTYDLRSWKFLPLSRWSWLFHHRKFNQGVIIAALVGVILFLAATCSLVYWYIWRYKDKDTVKYTNVEQATDEEVL